MMAPSLSSKILLSSGSKVLRSPNGLYCRCTKHHRYNTAACAKAVLCSLQ